MKKVIRDLAVILAVVGALFLWYRTKARPAPPAAVAVAPVEKSASAELPKAPEVIAPTAPSAATPAAPPLPPPGERVQVRVASYLLSGVTPEEWASISGTLRQLGPRPSEWVRSTELYTGANPSFEILGPAGNSTLSLEVSSADQATVSGNVRYRAELVNGTSGSPTISSTRSFFSVAPGTQVVLVNELHGTPGAEAGGALSGRVIVLIVDPWPRAVSPQFSIVTVDGTTRYVVSGTTAAVNRAPLSATQLAANQAVANRAGFLATNQATAPYLETHPALAAALHGLQLAATRLATDDGSDAVRARALRETVTSILGNVERNAASIASRPGEADPDVARRFEATATQIREMP